MPPYVRGSHWLIKAYCLPEVHELAVWPWTTKIIMIKAVRDSAVLGHLISLLSMGFKLLGKSLSNVRCGQISLWPQISIWKWWLMGAKGRSGLPGVDLEGSSEQIYFILGWLGQSGLHIPHHKHLPTQSFARFLSGNITGQPQGSWF